jgi:hypothetical protein
MQHWFREDQDPFAEFDGRRRPARQPDDAGWAVSTHPPPTTQPPISPVRAPIPDPHHFSLTTRMVCNSFPSFSASLLSASSATGSGTSEITRVIGKHQQRGCAHVGNRLSLFPDNLRHHVRTLCRRRRRCRKLSTRAAGLMPLSRHIPHCSGHALARSSFSPPGARFSGH